MKKKILLIAVIMAAVFTGCSEKTEDKETNGENNTTETVAVTDLLGREVEVPDDVESCNSFGGRRTADVMLCRRQDMVIGVEKGEHEKTLAKCYNYVYNDIFKELPVVGTGGSGSYEAYEEEILKLAPDVIFASYPEDLADDLQSKTAYLLL